MRRKENGEFAIKVAALLSLGTAVFFSMGWPFFHFITYAGKKKSPERKEGRKKWFALKHTQINHPRNGFAVEYDRVRSWCETQPMQDWYMHSRDGLNLHACYYPVENAKRFVILCHGYRGTRFGTVAHIAEFLREEKCNLLFIDQRCCGESEGDYITFGARESLDILDWLHRVQAVNPEHLPIYLYGQSMGATSILLASGQGLPTEVRGLIADCGFCSMKQQMRDVASGWFHLKWIELLLFRVDIFCRICGGFAMGETDTAQALQRNNKPVLFFHGSEDTYVWPHNTVENYERCRAEKEMVMIRGARHVCSSYVNPELYRRKVKEFFEKHDGVQD